MVKCLKDFKVESRKTRPAVVILPIDFRNSEATERIVMHNIKRVIQHHKDELNKLAYK